MPLLGSTRDAGFRIATSMIILRSQDRDRCKLRAMNCFFKCWDACSRAANFANDTMCSTNMDFCIGANSSSSK
eukprot:9210212-Lingulodinium_polyedra.AAC.1